jgi:hypothetical protein
MEFEPVERHVVFFVELGGGWIYFSRGVTDHPLRNPQTIADMQIEPALAA